MEKNLMIENLFIFFFGDFQFPNIFSPKKIQ